MDKNSNGASIALYRKYRPASFKDVVGQENVVKVLEASAKAGEPAHAYLFSGSRGTGKTSVARILAKTLGTTDNDLVEIDAASNRGIDDIRELREAVRTNPFDSKYKVYIIDEAHMLTKEAFNALLKTLEEPPKHVIFILATTELDKLPETVISRCQQFSFKKPSEEVLKNTVLDVAKKEEFKIDVSGAELIALLGDGSFRDALGILQKVMSFSKDKKISRKEIEEITGAPSAELINNFILAILKKDAELGINAIMEAKKQDVEMKVYMKLILHKVRLALLLKYAPLVGKKLVGELGEEDNAFMDRIMKPYSAGITSGLLRELLDCYSQIDRSIIAELPLELALVKIVGENK
ncbi:MAG: DNA polymerase III, subunit gamma and tau [Candidatus Lloydbacteria bacterium RIFCSPHIGHO2_01_FULL_41_20]|uniref:DNA polymerase III subunit gamma/tau n=1 Tax=Candidatus Lloydbacteria bacterium RIFCSPHIGHO2_01_FULL_41_20 TaxID=1798657 RepID=A0A1G2CTN6_9BACT|nr:MAG: DNA polymerase III, subunit gamma and tau [Candidatus Lloydbacteria bacterium RIFCSPHIGHO2_01_FULL_41_20]